MLQLASHGFDIKIIVVVVVENGIRETTRRHAKEVSRRTIHMTVTETCSKCQCTIRLHDKLGNYQRDGKGCYLHDDDDGHTAAGCWINPEWNE